MKNLILVLTSICTLFISNLNAQWFLQNPSPQGKSLRSVEFINSTTGWIVGEDGIILKTTNGGIIWTSQASGTSSWLFGISFIDENNGWAVGGDGLIIRTTNGGIIWNPQVSPTTQSLREVYFSDLNNGTTIGAFSNIYRTTNSGTTWTSQSIAKLNDIFYIDANNGWGVGDYGLIFKTTNGGNTWTYPLSGTTYHLRGVSFSDENNGTVVGGGIILRTTDGGTTWTSQSITYSLNGVCFSDLENGTAVGGNGIIQRTTNGGITWISQMSGTTNLLWKVSFTDANNGTVVGEGGTVLRTTNGGITFVEEEKIDEVPTEFSLLQNYPNPFNPSTKIKYAISGQQYAILNVYDILGNEIETLVNEEKSSGTYEVTWNAVGLPSGVYFYQLRAGSFIETRKMILLR